MSDANTQKLLRLPAPSLLLGVQSLGVKLSVEAGQLAYAGKPKILTGELLDLLKARKADLLGALQIQPAPHRPPVVGQSVEEFIAEHWPEAADDQRLAGAIFRQPTNSARRCGREASLIFRRLAVKPPTGSRN